MMHFIAKLLAIFTTFLFVYNVDGQTAEISIPASVKINQTELRIICSPGTGFSSVLAIALKKNVSNFANMVSLITISAEGMLWGTSYSVYRRSTASGNLDSNGANLELTFNANNLTCGDAGGYSCSITGFIDGNNIITTNSEQRTLQVHALPKEMDSVVVKVNNVMTFDRIFKVGTTVQLSCTGDIGSFPNEPNPSIRFCLKRRTENLFTGVTGFPTLSEATKKNDCMYRRTSTWSYNLTASDQNIRFMCESGYGIFCESGSAKRYVNITIEQEEPGTSAQDTETSNAGVIVGAIVGALAFLFLIILLVYFLVVRRKSGGETYRTKEDVPGFNGAPEGPVYSIPSKERNSGTGREHERDRDRDRRPRVDEEVGPDIPLTPPKRTELHYADLDIASKPPGTEVRGNMDTPTEYASVRFN